MRRIVGPKKHPKRELSIELKYGVFKKNTIQKQKRQDAGLSDRSLSQQTNSRMKLNASLNASKVSSFINKHHPTNKFGPHQEDHPHVKFTRSVSSKKMHHRPADWSRKKMKRDKEEGTDFKKSKMEPEGGGSEITEEAYKTDTKQANRTENPIIEESSYQMQVASAAPKLSMDLHERKSYLDSNVSNVAVNNSEGQSSVLNSSTTVVTNPTERGPIIITDRESLDTINKIIHYNENHPGSIYTMTYNEISVRSGKEGRMLTVLSPIIKSKRLQHLSEHVSRRINESRGEDIEESVNPRTAMKVKFLSDDQCEVYIHNDLDGVALADPHNQKSRKIITREKTPFIPGGSIKQEETGWESLLPSMKMVSQKIDETKKINVPGESENAEGIDQKSSISFNLKQNNAIQGNRADNVNERESKTPSKIPNFKSSSKRLIEFLSHGSHQGKRNCSFSKSRNKTYNELQEEERAVFNQMSQSNNQLDGFKNNTNGGKSSIKLKSSLKSQSRRKYPPQSSGVYFFKVQKEHQNDKEILENDNKDI